MLTLTASPRTTKTFAPVTTLSRRAETAPTQTQATTARPTFWMTLLRALSAVAA